MKLLELVFLLALASCGIFFITSQKADYLSLMLSKDELAPATPTLVLVPTLTANAYEPGAFYDYYAGKCDHSCLTTTISHNTDVGEAGSENTIRTLQRVGYVTISDFVVDYHLRADPDWLKPYHTIIILHSEYVTQRLFDALQKHPHVVYLVPNANHALVELNGVQMTLVSGHSYNGKYNAFDWEYENSNLEYDKECKDWEFKPIRNGYQLNCNPELVIHKNKEILKALKDL